MAVPGGPERQRIDQRFTQDQAFRGHQCGFIPDPTVCPRQVNMFGRPGPQAVNNFAAIHFLHFAIQTDHRNDQRAAEVFMPAVTQQPGSLKLRADLRPGFQLSGGQAIPQCPVGKAQLKLRH
ncbi:hypothetical protein Xmir_04431 [Xenorhabdus miraniensis]|uniref:Uncharacterized protein n=1 Tax=Xenorhabdus miraniensis TaxID=351674 RepID=A0A2D0J7J8_9GAMM|nr:hypothetical protein Xmir_04431 [Xenorhabdus miraniensis]